MTDLIPVLAAVSLCVVWFSFVIVGSTAPRVASPKRWAGRGVGAAVCVALSFLLAWRLDWADKPESWSGNIVFLYAFWLLLLPSALLFGMGIGGRVAAEVRGGRAHRQLLAVALISVSVAAASLAAGNSVLWVSGGLIAALITAMALGRPPAAPRRAAVVVARPRTAEPDRPGRGTTLTLVIGGLVVVAVFSALVFGDQMRALFGAGPCGLASTTMVHRFTRECRVASDTCQADSLAWRGYRSAGLSECPSSEAPMNRKPRKHFSQSSDD